MQLGLALRAGLQTAQPLVSGKERLWPVDGLRGVAVAAMVAYHFLWDLSFFGLYPADVTQGAWRWFAGVVAGTFLLLVGISMSLAAARRPPTACAWQWQVRGLKLWGWAVIISLVTRWAVGEQFVRFGILHRIGTALLLAPVSELAPVTQLPQSKA